MLPCVANVPIFADLPLPVQDAIARRLVHKSYATGEVVAMPGDPGSLRVIHRGRVRQSRLTDAGTEQLLRILTPGDFTGEGAVLTGQNEQLLTTAMTPANVCVLSAKDLADVLGEHPQVAMGMLVVVTQRLIAAEEQLTAITARSVAARLSEYLLALAEASGSQQAKLPMTKKDLASFLGTTPETISRRLRALEDAKLIAQKPGEVTILDADALAFVE